MKLINSSITVLILGTLLFTSCGKNHNCMEGNGSVVTQEIQLSSINGINISGSMNAVISQGETQQVVVVGQVNIISQLVRDVYDGVWDARLRDGCYKDYELTLYVTIPTLKNVELSGSGFILINDFTEQADLSMGIQGSGNLTLNQFSGAKNLSVDIDGSGIVQANSDIESLNQLTIAIDGSGEYRGFVLSSETCNIDIEGSAHCEVNVVKNLGVKIKGSGEVYYMGNPSVNSQINGSGKIHKAN